MAIIDRQPPISGLEGEEEILRHLHEHPERYSHIIEREPIRGISNIALLSGELVVVSAVAVRFVSRIGFNLKFLSPRVLDLYPTVVVDPGRPEAGEELLAFKYFNEPPVGRGEIVTAFARDEPELVAWPLDREIIQ